MISADICLLRVQDCVYVQEVNIRKGLEKMCFIEKIMCYGLFNKGDKIGMWDLDTLYDKVYHNPKPFTFAEKHALLFLQEMGDCMGPREKWVRPYGDVLNEHRELH